LIFRLIAAKLFADRKYEGQWLQDDPKAVIKNVESLYFKNEQPMPVLRDEATQNSIWSHIRKSFHFQNLSVETLAYVYENTLVTKDFRRRTGTHGTPPNIAEYVLKHLPIETLTESERHVFEPFSGHAVFLLAALRRLRDILPASKTSRERHDYFVSMLSGLEYDDFALEIARLSLTLADHPNPNGWNLQRGDVFKGNTLEKNLSIANIILCNPPFEDFSDEDRENYTNLESTHRPEEILLRVLRKPPKMLGFVLPKVFISGRGYRHVRNLLSNTYSSIEIVALPDNVFKYSEAETVLLIASGLGAKTSRLLVGQVYEHDLERFYKTFVPSYSTCVESDSGLDFDKALWLSRLAELWHSLEHLDTLGHHISKISRGIEYNFSIKGKANLAKAVSDEPLPGFVRGLHRVSDSLEPFLILDNKYLNVSPEDMRVQSYDLPWNQPKVIMNAWRRSRGMWRVTAAVDLTGLVCIQSFHAIWPKDEFLPEVIAAILNSPLANAYIADHELGAKEIRIDTVKSIPIPCFTKEQQQQISQLVHQYQDTRHLWREHLLEEVEAQEECKRLIRLLDIAVMEAYNLTPKLMRMLLDYLAEEKRPLPFVMRKYVPKGFQASVVELQSRIATMKLTQKGTAKERAQHQQEVNESLKPARLRANTERLGD
jgi:hypothetical protein